MSKTFQTQIKNIYAHLQDSESKELFDKRLAYSLTGDTFKLMSFFMKRHHDNWIKKIDLNLSFLEQSKKKVAMFGAGIRSCDVFDICGSSVKFSAVIESNSDKVGKFFYTGIPIISFEEFIKDKENYIVVIASEIYCFDMMRKLLKNGFSQDNIVNLANGIQYFDLPELQASDNEYFIDAGVFDGISTRYFFEWLTLSNKNAKGKSYCFEVDKERLPSIKENFKKWELLQDTVLIPKGLWNSEGELRFAGSGTMAHQAENGDLVIPVTTLDKALANEKVTFIKMDIEGAELNALKGAEQIIKTQRPKLAISIYHKPEDIWDIPSLLLEYNSDYKFYVRHYVPTCCETILYAL